MMSDVIELTRGQIVRGFAAQLAECYPSISATYQAGKFEERGYTILMAQQQATWTHTLELHLNFEESKVTFSAQSFVTARPFEACGGHDVEIVDNVNDMHRVIRSYFA